MSQTNTTTTANAQQLHDLAITVISLNEESARWRDQMSAIEAHTILTIQAAKNEEGKALYSNDKTRDAALTLNLLDHPEYAALKESLQQSERRRAAAIAAQDLLRREIRESHLARWEAIASRVGPALAEAA